MTFPVIFFKKKLKKKTLLRTRILSGVYLTAVLDYLVSEIFDLAHSINKIVQKARCKVIKPKHIDLAIRSDSELSKFLHYVIIPEASRISVEKKD